MPVPDLVEAGIRAYLAGREDDALAAFEEVLRLDPGNGKARWYLDRMGEASRALGGSRRGGASARPIPAEPAPVAPVAPVAPAAPARRGPEPAPPDLSRLELDLDLEPRAPPSPPSPLSPPAATAFALADDPTSTGPVRPRSSAAVEALHDEDYAPSPWDDGPAATAPIELDPSGGLDLRAVAEKSDLRPLVPEGPGERGAQRTDVEVWLSAAKELFALGDFSGSLELIEKILQVDPEHGEARDYLRQNEATLISMYESKLGPLTAIPRLAVKPEEILWLNLDHRAGFLLAQIDGTVDYDSLFALSGLPRLDTARILANLIAEGVITS